MAEEKNQQAEETKKKVVEAAKEKIEKVSEEIEKASEDKAAQEKKESAKAETKKAEVKAKPKKAGSETLSAKPPRKGEAKVNVKNIPMSTKHSAAICDFIRNKKIGKAISDVEQVLKMKKAVPMKGEIPHRKGKGMMSGRFPQNAANNFLKLLKSLAANATHNGLENPVIVEAIANLGERPYGKFGQVRRKRTHVIIKAADKKR